MKFSARFAASAAPPPPQLFSSSDMRVNFPSSSDSMQILKAGVASPRFVGKSGFYHFLSCADRYRLVVTNTYPLFVCLFVCHYLLLEDEEGVRGIEIDCTSVL